MTATELKAKFQTGDIPTQQDFSDFIDFIIKRRPVITFTEDVISGIPTVNYICILANINIHGTISEIPVQIIEIQKNPDDSLLYSSTYILKNGQDINIQDLIDQWNQYANLSDNGNRICTIESTNDFRNFRMRFFKMLQTQ